MALTPRQKHNLAKGAFGTAFTLFALWGLGAVGNWAIDTWGTTGALAFFAGCVAVFLPLGIALDRSDYGPGYSLRASLRKDVAAMTVGQWFWVGGSFLVLAILFLFF